MSETIWITTDAAGFIIACSPVALNMLGYSARGARGRELPNMFIRNRPRLSELLAVGQGGVLEREAEFRPNDRKSVRVRFSVRLAEEAPAGAPALLWTFTVHWRVGMRLPVGVDRRQLITLWRTSDLRCLFAPGGVSGRRLFVCGSGDEVVLEECTADASSALARAEELRQLASAGTLGAQGA